MPSFADLLSSQLQLPDPNDQLRDQLGQGQNLAGLSPQPGQGAAPPPNVDPSQMMGGGPPGPPGMGGPPGMAPSPNVPGPLAALAALAAGAGKPKIKLKSSAFAKSPAKKIKPKIKPKIKLKAAAYGGPI